MNRKTLISGYQFFCMIFLFQIGSTSLVGVTSMAKQDTWISMIFSMLLGSLLFFVYIKLYENYPEYPLTKYVQFILGKNVGKLLSLVYIVFFIYIGSRVLRDMEDLLTMTMFNSTSLISIGILMMFIVIYGLFKGIETIARTTEVIFVFIILSIFIILVFEVISKLHHIANLRPVLEEGWIPVLKALPYGVIFPYGELITFTMLMPYLNKKETALKVGIPAIFFSGFIILILVVKSIATLGISVMERAEFPILTATSYINIVNFVQRLDTFIVILMVFGGFIKVFIYTFCAVSGSADLFNVKKSSQLIYPISLIILISSLLMASNHIEHRNEGFELIPFYLHLPLHFIIPLILLFISWLQKKIKSNN